MQSGQNFGAETDPDGVHVVSWDMPGRSILLLDTGKAGDGFYRRFPPAPAAT